jgi:F-type H+-transporting ATPase subunit b
MALGMMMRTRSLLSLAAMQLISLWLMVPAFAAEATAEHGAAETTAKAGLPQLDPTYFAGQLFWLFVTFGLLYLLMAKLALPKVAATQKKRDDHLARELSAAARASDEAKAMQAGHEKAIADAKAKAAATMADMATAMAKESKEKQAALQQQLVSRLADSEQKMSTMRVEALHHVDAMAAELATMIVKQATGAAGPDASALLKKAS